MRAGLIWVALALATGAEARTGEYRVQPASVRAHEMALAGDALRGRGSATSDEAKAAAYVAAQFAKAGLKPAPGMTGYLQTAKIVRTRLTAPVTLTIDGTPVPGATLLTGGGAAGAKGVLATGTPASAEVLLWTDDKGPLRAAFHAARAAKARLLVLPDGEAAKRLADTYITQRLEGVTEGPGLAVVTVPAAQIAMLAARAGAAVALTVPGVAEDAVTTTNAIGYLPGTDPKAKLLLLSAHLDHLGVLPDGTVMHGANDDASGTTAVIELARAMAAGRAPRRGILFVAYGSEEMGGFGSRYFAAHPPVPIDRIAANIEFEMIGGQDPKLPKGALMMTGYDRSNLGAALTAHGAAVAADPYPDEHFFERSDNYQLALAGVVAHTLSGWATTPTYHSKADTVANLDIGFMTRAIQSLVVPVRWLADGDFEPAWQGEGRPKR